MRFHFNLSILLFALALAMPLDSHAQLGNLMRRGIDKATDAARNKKKNNKEQSETQTQGDDQTVDPYGASQLDQIRRNKESANQTPQRNDECPIYEGTSDKVIATWNDKTNVFTLVRTFTEGDLAGQPITYALNFETGELTRNDGQLMGKLIEGGVEVPSIGTVMINSSTGGGLNMDGKGIGKATRTEAYCFGKQLARFRREAASRDIVTLFCLVECVTPESMAQMKSDMEARHAREAAGQQAFTANMKKITAGNFLNTAGNKIGSMTADGTVLDKLGQKIGVVKADGQVTDAYNRSLGRIEPNGQVYKGNDWIGKIQPNGAVEAPQRTPSGIGRINGSDFYDANSNRIGRFTGEGVNIAAVCYYFFFNFK